MKQKTGNLSSKLNTNDANYFTSFFLLTHNSLLSTKFHKFLFCSFRCIAMTSIQTDTQIERLIYRQTGRRTDRQRDIRIDRRMDESKHYSRPNTLYACGIDTVVSHTMPLRGDEHYS